MIPHLNPHENIDPNKVDAIIFNLQENKEAYRIISEYITNNNYNEILFILNDKREPILKQMLSGTEPNQRTLGYLECLGDIITIIGTKLHPEDYDQEN